MNVRVRQSVVIDRRPIEFTAQSGKISSVHCISHLCLTKTSVRLKYRNLSRARRIVKCHVRSSSDVIRDTNTSERSLS